MTVTGTGDEFYSAYDAEFPIKRNEIVEEFLRVRELSGLAFEECLPYPTYRRNYKGQYEKYRGLA